MPSSADDLLRLSVESYPKVLQKEYDDILTTLTKTAREGLTSTDIRIPKAKQHLVTGILDKLKQGGFEVYMEANSFQNIITVSWDNHNGPR